MNNISGSVRLKLDPEAMAQYREQIRAFRESAPVVVDPNPMIQELSEWHDEDGKHVSLLLSMRRANVYTIVHCATGRIEFHPNLGGITLDDVRTVRRMLKEQQRWLKRQLAMLRPSVRAGGDNTPPAE